MTNTFALGQFRVYPEANASANCNSIVKKSVFLKSAHQASSEQHHKSNALDGLKSFLQCFQEYQT